MKRSERPSPVGFHGMVTVSPAMITQFERVKRVARTDSSVLIRGETGTGKELFARALHDLSGRAGGPFRAVNCATLTPDHLASELFGHVRGAFTGAVKDRPGLFALADKGTLFLDEIAEIPLDLQSRLLRVLQERVYVPLGGDSPREVDVRVLAATNRALRAEVAAGRFREDLMYRVRVVTLYLPTLVEREGDVTALSWHFIDEFNSRSAAYGGRQIDEIEDAAIDLMDAYPWPGNIRELRNVIEQAYAMGEGPRLLAEDLTPELRGEPAVDRSPARKRAILQHAVDALADGRADAQPADAPPGLDEAEQIRAALGRCGGRKAEAAAALGLSRTTLWRRMKALGI